MRELDALQAPGSQQAVAVVRRLRERHLLPRWSAAGAENGVIGRLYYHLTGSREVSAERWRRRVSNLRTSAYEYRMYHSGDGIRAGRQDGVHQAGLGAAEQQPAEQQADDIGNDTNLRRAATDGDEIEAEMRYSGSAVAAGDLQDPYDNVGDDFAGLSDIESVENDGEGEPMEDAGAARGVMPAGVSDFLSVQRQTEAEEEQEVREEVGSQLHTRPVQIGRPLWGAYTYSGESFVPYGVRPADTTSWFLCPLIADAAGLGFMYPHNVVPRPGSGDLTWSRCDYFVQHDITWGHLVEWLRQVMQLRHITRRAMVSMMDSQAHWPARVQERLVSGICRLHGVRLIDSMQRMVGRDGVASDDAVSELLAAAAASFASEWEGLSYVNSGAVRHMLCHAVPLLVRRRNRESGEEEGVVDQCSICLEEFAVGGSQRQLICCGQLMHDACIASTVESRNSKHFECPLCKECWACRHPNVWCSEHGGGHEVHRDQRSRRQVAFYAGRAEADNSNHHVADVELVEVDRPLNDGTAVAEEDERLPTGAAHSDTLADTNDAGNGDSIRLDEALQQATDMRQGGRDIADIRSVLLRVRRSEVPRPLGPRQRWESLCRVQQDQMRSFYRLWHRSHAEWNAPNRLEYR